MIRGATKLQVGGTACLSVEANTNPCAHICRYCSIGDRGEKFPLERWLSFVEGFRGWTRTDGPPGFEVQFGFPGPSYGFELSSFVTLSKAFQRMTGHGISWIPLGGLKMQPPETLTRWLQQRQEVGLKGVAASFVGTRSVHDRWNGRRGDFDFLMRTLHTAAELGLGHGTTLFITKSSLPLLGELTDLLDGLPTPHQGRHARPFYYIGHGAHHESERLTEEDRDNIPAFAWSSLASFGPLRSEREWISVMRNEPPEPMRLSLCLELTRSNIDRLEEMTFSEIFARLDTRARMGLSELPSLLDLAEHYSDPTNLRLYPQFDLRRLWFERFLERNPVELDRSVLHYHLGRSRRPPVLWNPSSVEGLSR